MREGEREREREGGRERERERERPALRWKFAGLGGRFQKGVYSLDLVRRALEVVAEAAAADLKGDFWIAVPEKN